MSTYRMGALNPAFPHVKRVVAWFVFIDPEYDATFVFSASERGARAQGARHFGAWFEEVRARRVPELDDLTSNYTDRDVIVRGCGTTCRCSRLVYADHEPEFDSRGSIVSCDRCRKHRLPRGAIVMESSANVLECDSCEETMRLVAETQQAMRCRCGASWLPERERHHETSTKAKRTQSPEETVAKDLALLARWHSRFYGRAMALEPSIGGDREAQEDERSQEFHRAAQIHRKLEAMRSGDGCLHYQVLWFAHVEREAVKDLHWEIGWRFATPKRRAKWAQNKLVAIAHAAIRRYGAKVHSAACAAYQASNGDLS